MIPNPKSSRNAYPGRLPLIGNKELESSVICRVQVIKICVEVYISRPPFSKLGILAH